MISKSLFWPGLLVLIGYGLVVGLVPTLVTPSPTDFSAAAELGYDIDVAFMGMVAWSVVSFAALWALGRRLRPPPVEPDAEPPGRIRWIEVAVVFAVVLIAHWPPFLTRYGPYAEEQYLLSALARMACGQAPFLEFEFLYGPLMIAMADGWMDLVGFSMQAYYWLYALLLSAFFAVLAIGVQRFVPKFVHRLVIFVILSAFAFDALMGLNWFGWRKYLSVIAMLVIAARPRDLRNAAIAGAILAVHLAYSLDYGLFGLAACGAIYGVLLLRPAFLKTIAAGLVTLIVALAGFAAIAAITTGDLIGYITSTRAVLEQASAHNTGAFAFYFTVHSLAAFAVLSLGLAAVALGMGRLRREEPSADDLFLLATVVFAVLALKSGFQRADVWHMTPPFFPLAFALLAANRRRLFVLDGLTAATTAILLALVAATNVIGVAPIAMAHVDGMRNAARDTLRRVPKEGGVIARGYTVQNERTWRDGDIAALSAFLARPDMKDRPVLFYNRMWILNFQTGVCPIGYLNYEWMYGDAVQPIGEVVRANPDALVVMPARSFESLKTGAYEEPGPPNLDAIRRIGLITSTVHSRQSPIERRIKDDLWRLEVGSLIRDTHKELARFGGFVVVGVPPETHAQPPAQ